MVAPRRTRVIHRPDLPGRFHPPWRSGTVLRVTVLDEEGGALRTRAMMHCCRRRRVPASSRQGATSRYTSVGWRPSPRALGPRRGHHPRQPRPSL